MVQSTMRREGKLLLAMIGMPSQSDGHVWTFYRYIYPTRGTCRARRKSSGRGPVIEDRVTTAMPTWGSCVSY
jgi:hypothetical protein